MQELKDEDYTLKIIRTVLARDAAKYFEIRAADVRDHMKQKFDETGELMDIEVAADALLEKTKGTLIKL